MTLTTSKRPASAALTALGRGRTTSALAALALLLSACGGGSDGSNDPSAAAAGPDTGTATTTTATAGGGCTGKAAAFFASAAGSYTGKAATFDNVNFANSPATVAGVANGSTQTVTIGADCTVKVGGLTLSYKDGSYAEFPGTGADAGKTQVDVDLSGTGVAMPHFERWTDQRRGLSLFDPAHDSWGVRIDEP